MEFKIEFDIDKTDLVRRPLEVAGNALQLKEVFGKTYLRLNRGLRYNAANFNLLKFTIKYLVAVAVICLALGLVLLWSSDVFAYAGFLFLFLLVPYFAFVAVLVGYYVLQQIYLVVVALALTIRKLHFFS